jgi:hypothetical protein
VLEINLKPLNRKDAKTQSKIIKCLGFKQNRGFFAFAPLRLERLKGAGGSQVLKNPG